MAGRAYLQPVTIAPRPPAEGAPLSEGAKPVLLAQVCAHKLFAPEEFKGSIRRDAILDQIFAEHGPRVVLFQAPAGHGKTTLLQQVRSTSEAQGVLSGWLTFDEADNDLRRFYLHLQALLSSVLRIREQPGPAGVDESGKLGLWRPVDGFLNRVIDAGERVSLFFDEFQCLNDRSILSFFRELLERIPDSVRIFIGSRSVPDIGLTRIVLSNRARVLRADELRFSDVEVARFFAGVPELKINAAEIEAIYRQTEGWPAALQLFRLTLNSPAVRQALRDLDTFRPPELAEYLADSVLLQQPPTVQEFLLRTSLLTRLCAPLCDEVTGMHGSQQMLQFLQRSGLFVRSLDSELRWFRFHSLFSSFLQEQLRQLSEEAIVEVHRRAAKWYRKHELFEEAMHHAMGAREYALATDIMEAWAPRLIAEGRLATVERWYECLPLDEIERRPDLVVEIAWALTFLRRHPKLGPILQMLDRQEQAGLMPSITNPKIVRAMAAILVDDPGRAFDIIKSVDVHCANADGFQAFELGAAANLKGYQAQNSGELERARELLAIGYAHSSRAEATFSLGYALANAALVLMAQGELRESLDRFRIGISEPRIYLDQSFASAALVSCYIQALYEDDEIEAAESQFLELKAMIAEATLLDYLAVAYVAMARIHDLRGRPSHASALLDEAESIGLTNAWPRLVRSVNWERTRRLLLRGELERARSLVSRLSEVAAGAGLPEGWIPFSEDTEGDAIGRIRLAIHLGESDSALRQIAHEQGIAQRTGRVRRQIKLHVLEALAYQRGGVCLPAHKSLRRALQLAQRPGFVRVILDEGQMIVDLLWQEYESSSSALAGSSHAPRDTLEFIGKLLNASGIDLHKTQAMNRFEPLESLSRRETEMLVFLANGVSNKEMARRLYVSENTVKFHLKNIYSKLGVVSRVQAINAARQMGLI
jgi:LuxR family transcriptional regulator, maltose regulon positive regulatory protein